LVFSVEEGAGSMALSFSSRALPVRLDISNIDAGLLALLPIRDVLGVLFRRVEALVEGGREDAGFIVNVADTDDDPSLEYSEDE
jgi:hypothetical protein